MIRETYSVDLIITGSAEHVSFWLDQFDQIATLTDVTDPYQSADDQLTVHATISRTVPLTGGPR